MRSTTVFCVALLLSACGGGGYSSPTPPPPPPPPPPSIEGLWNLSRSGSVIAISLIDQGGRIVGIANDTCATLVEGQLSVSGSAFTGSGVSVFRSGCTAADSSTGETWTDSGSFVEAASITESKSITTANGTKSTVSNSWAFDATYNSGSALSKVAGNWTDGTNTLSIDANGVMSEQDPTTGCMLAGQVSIINAAKDLYAVSLTFSSCSGTLAQINGVTETGLGAIYPSSPVDFLIVASAPLLGGATFVTGGVIQMNPVVANAGLRTHPLRIDRPIG